MASEMIYPLMPLFLTRVLGAGAMSLGVIEGVAEAANSVLKLAAGRVADRTGSPKPLVLAGDGLSGPSGRYRSSLLTHGLYAALGIGSLIASLLFGWLWTRVSPSAAFFTGAGLAILATALLYLLFSSRNDATHSGHER